MSPVQSDGSDMSDHSDKSDHSVAPSGLKGGVGDRFPGVATPGQTLTPRWGLWNPAFAGEEEDSQAGTLVLLLDSGSSPE
jgi:hypothetical protein